MPKSSISKWKKWLPKSACLITHKRTKVRKFAVIVKMQITEFKWMSVGALLLSINHVTISMWNLWSFENYEQWEYAKLWKWHFSRSQEIRYTDSCQWSYVTTYIFKKKKLISLIKSCKNISNTVISYVIVYLSI